MYKSIYLKCILQPDPGISIGGSCRMMPWRNNLELSWVWSSVIWIEFLSNWMLQFGTLIVYLNVKALSQLFMFSTFKHYPSEYMCKEIKFVPIQFDSDWFDFWQLLILHNIVFWLLIIFIWRISYKIFIRFLLLANIYI